jgi:hypothetical protein
MQCFNKKSCLIRSQKWFQKIDLLRDALLLFTSSACYNYTRVAKPDHRDHSLNYHQESAK